MNTIIYARVSTDEQARGFSLDYQIEVMNKYCDLKGFNIIKTFKEDESAKDFGGRPEWTNLSSYIRSNKSDVDLVLVQKWDRYSRDILSALGMLEEFRVMGVEVNSVEQWLDMAIPDNKLMLSIYLSQGEVERHKISARVKDGNYKALSSGYYINKAPYGYKNIKIHDNKPSLTVVEHKAEFIKEAFQRVLTEIESAEYVLKCMRKRGFKMSKSNFLRSLRKVIYTGRIVVPAYKKEEETIVMGFHEPIVDIKTFNKVQIVLDGKTWNLDLNSATFFYPDFTCLTKSQNGTLYAGGITSNTVLENGIIFETSDGINWEYNYFDEGIYSISSNGINETFAIGNNGFVVTNASFTLVKEEIIDFDFSIYPNPTSNQLFIDLNGEENWNISVFDASMKQTNINVSDIHISQGIDVSMLPKGIYYLVFIKDKKKLIKKIIKS